MTTINFRPAAASQVKPLVGLYSESGAGKTRSALLLAKGFTGDMAKVAMIETESGRGEAYANDPEVGGYNVISLREEFSPKTYGAAIGAAEKAGVQCLIVDSASHEWEGVRGVLDMAADNQAAGKKGVLVWQQPKIEHSRHFMLRLMQTPIPLVIVCMRAKYPMEEVSKDGRKEWVRSKLLAPKQSEDILFEMFVHGWIDHEHRFHGTKYTVDALRKALVDGEPLSVESGRRLAAWTKSNAAASTPGERITEQQAADLETMCAEHDGLLAAVKKKAGIEALADMPADKYASALKWTQQQIEKQAA